MPEITKALVHATFMAHFKASSEPEERRRALESYNATLDTLTPWKKDMSAKESEDLDLVMAILTDILQDDYKITLKTGQKLPPESLPAIREGAAAAAKFINDHEDRVPPLATDEKGRADWIKAVNALAFELVPPSRIPEKDWTNWFIGGFAGAVYRHLCAKAEASE